MTHPFLALLLIVFWSAAASVADADEVGSREAGIVRGQPVEPGGAYGTVALLTRLEASGAPEPTRHTMLRYKSCSAVLISPTVAVTAAHCVDACQELPLCETEDGTPYRCEECNAHARDSNAFHIAAGLQTVDDVWTAELAPVRDVIMHAGYRSWPDRAPGIDGGHDIALLRLDVPVTARSPVPLLSAERLPELSTGLAQGYGQQLPNDSPELVSQDGFHSLLNEFESPIEYVGDHSITGRNGSDRSGICFGDSGGPLYTKLGNGLYLAGILSLGFGATDQEVCAEFAIYTSIPAYTEWIFEKAPEVMLVQPLGEGGCSVLRGTSSGAPLGFQSLVVLLFGLFALRRRLVGWLAAIVLVGGCGSDGAATLCTEERDPLGWFCNPTLAALDLQTAVAQAEREVTDLDGALLWRIESRNLTPDGDDAVWYFSYRDPGTDDERTVFVIATGEIEVDTSRYYAPDSCIPDRSVRPLDSRRLTHDAITRFEAELGPIELGVKNYLSLIQRHPCQLGQSDAHRRNVVRLQVPADGLIFHFAAYDDEGHFLGMSGPCTSLVDCE